jgi:hypothetical protein
MRRTFAFRSDPVPPYGASVVVARTRLTFPAVRTMRRSQRRDGTATIRVEDRVEQQEALDVLGLETDVDLATLKRRFRALAHDHHPDRGGDAMRFAAINDAYRQLTSGEPEPTAPPTVAKGRPSRTSTPNNGISRRIGIGLTAEALTGSRDGRLDELPMDARRLLTPLLFAELVLRLRTGQHLVLVSRAPNAWSNRFAAVLSEDAISTLRCSLTPSGHGVALELRARARSARRALATATGDAVIMPPEWRRQRSDAVTTISSTLPLATSSAETAISATARVLDLLDALDWPLAQWRLDVAASRTLLDAI